MARATLQKDVFVALPTDPLPERLYLHALERDEEGIWRVTCPRILRYNAELIGRASALLIAAWGATTVANTRLVRYVVVVVVVAVVCVCG